MSNAADFIHTLATNAGLGDSPELKSLLSDARLAAIEIPTTVENAIQSKHLTFESAKANEDLIKYFRANNLDPVDKSIMAVLQELEVDEAVINELKGVKSTYEKIPAAMKKIAELKGKAAKATADGATGKAAEYEKQVVALNEQIAGLKNQHNQEKADLGKQFENKQKSWLLNQLLLGYEYAGEQPKDVQMELASLLLNKQLQSNKWETRLENDNISLVTSEGTKVFDNNKEVTIKALADKIVSDNKLIKVSAPQQLGNKIPPTSQGQFNAPAQNANSVYDSHLEATLKQLQS